MNVPERGGGAPTGSGPPEEPTESFPTTDGDPTLEDALGPTAAGAAMAAGAAGVAGRSSHGAPELPTKVGPYPILRELGRGGMGVVYVARDPVLERPIALKVLPAPLAAHATAFERFQREARLLAAMNNPSIATIYSLESHEGTHFLTMELIAGESLAARLGSGPMSLEEALAVTRQIAVALEAAHKNGIVHLDLKPQNIMVTSEGGVKVLDFGIAMALGGLSDETGEVRTQKGRQEAISGTPGFMSPEQILGQPVDARADVWAFGCILYQCLAGRPAISGDGMRERIRATLETQVDLTALPPEIPARARDLVERCLVQDAEQRLASITIARRQIEEAIALRALPVIDAAAEPAPTNLPAQLARFVGREKQKNDLIALLAERRMVTLTGVGGGGKTRLAIEVGRSQLPLHPDGVWWIELAPLASGELVPGAVATTLGVKDEAGRTPTDVLCTHLRSRRALLILDNCEHALEAVAELTHALLSQCPELRVLATSRTALGLAGESLYQVPPMGLPKGSGMPVTELRAAESIQLFLVRATAVQPAFALTEENAPAVVQICRRLDGIPLAIELAAARVKVLSAEEIARRLDDRFRLLTSGQRGKLPHHQTLRALIDWSYDQLDEQERGLLRRLSLFADGWTLEAAETVCGGDGIEDWEVLDLLSHLIDKSLVEVDAEAGVATGMARYRMLETIRQYSRDRLLERAEGSEVLVRLRAFYTELAEQSEPLLTGRDQSQALVRLDHEHENFRLALDLCQAPDTDPEIGWRLAGALGRYWHMRGHWHEGRRACAALLDRPDAPRESAAAAKALSWAGNLAKLQGDYTQARSLLEESLEIHRRLGQESGIASSLNNLGNVLKDQGDFPAARAMYEESLSLQRKLGHTGGVALALNALGVLAHLGGDLRRAHALHSESLEQRRSLGDRSGVAASLNNLGAVAEALGETGSAIPLLEESLAIRKQLGDRWGSAAALTNLGRLAEATDDLPRARSFYEEGLATFEELGDRRGVAAALNNLGNVAARDGDRALARDLLRASLRRFRELEERAMLPSLLGMLGLVFAEDGDAERSADLLAAADALHAAVGSAATEKDARTREAALRKVSAALSPAEIQRRWEEAGIRPIEETIARALAEDGS